MKNKLKSYSFWMSVCAGIILVLNNIGKIFGFEISSELVTQIVDSICGVLVLFGVIETCKNDENKNMDENLNAEQKETTEKQNFDGENNKNINNENNKIVNKKNIADKERED